MADEQQSTAQAGVKDEKIVRAVRTTRELWNAYGDAVASLGTDRAKHLNAHMRRTVRKHARAQSAPDS